MAYLFNNNREIVKITNDITLVKSIISYRIFIIYSRFFSYIKKAES